MKQRSNTRLVLEQSSVCPHCPLPSRVKLRSRTSLPTLTAVWFVVVGVDGVAGVMVVVVFWSVEGLW